MQGYGRHEGDKQAASWIAGFGPAQFMADLSRVIMGWFACSIEVFLRRPGSFGERYIDWLRLWFAYGVVWLFAFPIAGIAAGGLSLIFFVIYVAFVVLSVLHKFIRWRKYRKGERWHSMSSGISWLAFLPFPYVVIYLFIEPAVAFGVGLLFYFFVGEKTVGVWLCVSAIFLFIKNMSEFYAERGQILDMIDSAIEAEHLRGVIVDGALAEQANGWRVIGITTKGISQEQKEALARSIERADPIRQREDLASEFAEAISNTTLKVLNVPPESEETPTETPEA